MILRRGGSALDGFAPEVGGPLGFAFDPEGIVVHPRTGHFYVSDEYGPSLYQINRAGQVVHRFEIPSGLLPRDALSGAVNHASDAGNNAGKRTNRGFEGLAITPEGRHVYAMLQSAMLDEGGASGVRNRSVKFDTHTRRAVAQYAYRMQGSSRGRGSAPVAINEHEFLVLERNNRGLGVDSNLEAPNKKVFRIDLDDAGDVSGIDLDSTGAAFTTLTKQALPWLDLAAAATLSDASLAALGGVSPEKWEGLAIGPRLADGSYLLLAGTDNDYSVTQNASGVQFDVYFKPGASAPTRIQCDIGSFVNCTAAGDDGSPGGALAAGFDFSGWRLIPGVLHALQGERRRPRGLRRTTARPARRR